MRSTAVLIWKEWQEMAWFAIAGLLIIDGVPLIEAAWTWTYGTRCCVQSAENAVLGMGGLYAIILAVAVTCRDLESGVKTFWLSRPIPVPRFLAVKYATGLTILLVITVPFLVVQTVTGGREPLEHYDVHTIFNSSSALVLLCHTPTLALIYSVSFLIGIPVRKAVPAALLSIAAALLVYFLPMLVPPLGFASVINMLAATNTLHHYDVLANYAGFLAVTLAGCGLAASASVLVLRRDWRLRANLGLLCWTLGGVVLLLLTTSIWQIGSNLTGERRTTLPFIQKTHLPFRLFVQDNRGLIGYWVYRAKSNAQPGSNLAQFDLSQPDAGLSAPLSLPNDSHRNYTLPMAASPSRSDRVYLTVYESNLVSGPDGTSQRENNRSTLLTLATGQAGGPRILNRLDLTEVIQPNAIAESMAVLGDRLYIWARTYQVPDWNTKDVCRLISIDISNADAPTVGHSVDLTQEFFRTCVRVVAARPGERIPNTCDFVLVPVPGASPRDRLELSMRLALSYWGPMAFEGDLLVSADKSGLTTYRLTSTENDVAHFTEIGSLRKPPLLRLVAAPLRLVMHNGRVCTIEQGIAQVVSIYDVSRPEQPRRIAHYAAPHNFFGLAFLGDGRLLVAGDELTILRVP